VVALFAAGAFLVASALSRDTRQPLLRVADGLLLPLIGLGGLVRRLGLTPVRSGQRGLARAPTACPATFTAAWAAATTTQASAS
jgi:hypothetical protein